MTTWGQSVSAHIHSGQNSIHLCFHLYWFIEIVGDSYSRGSQTGTHMPGILWGGRGGGKYTRDSVMVDLIIIIIAIYRVKI